MYDRSGLEIPALRFSLVQSGGNNATINFGEAVGACCSRRKQDVCALCSA